LRNIVCRFRDEATNPIEKRTCLTYKCDVLSSLLLAVALTTCDVHEILFTNGFRARMPRPVCVTRTDNPDSTIYQFSFTRDTRPFLEAYAGKAADFFYFVPEDGVGRSEACDAILRIVETVHGNVTHIGASGETPDGHCGEVLIRKPARNGVVVSPALHFWYSRLTASEEKAARGIIDGVEAR
jgi:hypothetical protein